jgi:hypothetical protein
MMSWSGRLTPGLSGDLAIAPVGDVAEEDIG